MTATRAEILPPSNEAARYCIRFARTAEELSAYHALRRQIFCDEQSLFDGDDRDEHDERAYPIIALDHATADVIGIVRIDQREPAVWYGSRLGIANEWRGIPGLGAGLIRTAVCSAHFMGCRQFLANVQRQNVPFFRRLHWKNIGDVEIAGLPHKRMEADLQFYPPRDPL